MAFSQNVLFAVFLAVTLILILINLIIHIPTYAKLVILIVALLFDILAFSTRYYTYLFGPLLKMKNGTLVLSQSEAFTLASSGNAVIVREGDGVWATAYIKVPVYKSGTEMSPEEKTDFASLFSRLLTLSRDPFMIASQLYIINKDDYIARIRDKMNDAEERYQKITNTQKSGAQLERVKGEVTMWHNLFDSINRTQSNSLVTYVMLSAFGGNEDEAVNLVLRKADELASGIGAIFGVNPTVMQGGEMLTFVEPEYMMPTVTIGEQIRQTTTAV